ncbi:MAG: hypothetical protein MUP47_03525 [Phycisphaerae bacterium]|nr:hypothetical protein [Phycisphaerae bacterium]
MKRFAIHPGGDVDVSVILLDWSCRESFHMLDYLARQDHPRQRYEVIWIEYYDTVAAEIRRRMDQASSAGRPPPVDTWLVMEMPRRLCYHKHLMYNVGLAMARGRIVVICDSDAMVGPAFLTSIVRAFKQDSHIVLHLDEVRNNHRGFHPFSYPSLEEVVGFGAVNWLHGRPSGLLDKADPLHSRNYGACMAALRSDLIDIGGADMHADYLGHIAGPYEMTWRLVNAGRREVWHDSQWLCHVWHPGQAGDENLVGPHDGRHISTRALLARASGRVQPFVAWPAIGVLQGDATGSEDALAQAVDPAWLELWRLDRRGGVRRTHTLSGWTIRLIERRPHDAAGTPPFAAKGVPLFGRRLGWPARLWHVPMMLGVAWRQVQVKRRAIGWSAMCTPEAIRREPGRNWNRLKEFLRLLFEYDRYLVRQCWLALAYSAQEGRRELIVYGQGEEARIACALAGHVKIKVRAVCPLGPNRPRRLFGRPTISEQAMAESSATVLLAALVNLPALRKRLEDLGLGTQRVIGLL